MAARRATPGSSTARTRSFELAPARPFSLDLTAARFASLPEVVNRFEGGVFQRLVLVERRPLLVRVHQVGSPARARLHVELTGDAARRAVARDVAVDLLERTLGIALPLPPFYRALRRDPILAAAIRDFRGLRPWGFGSLFEALLSAVLTQQVHLKFAYDVRRELCLAFGRRVRLANATHVAFPTPERLARESEARLREFRLSRAKASAIALLAERFASGALDEGHLRTLPDEGVVDALVALKGVGRWTAETALLRGLGRPDAFPAGDLGVVKYLARGLLGSPTTLPEAEMREFSERWRPHRALALTYAYAELARERS